MLKQILKRLCYGHQITDADNLDFTPNPPTTDYVSLHPIIPNYSFMHYMAKDRHFDFDANAPVHEVLPFTLFEYISAGFINAISNDLLSGSVRTVRPDEKYINKRVVNIPDYHMGNLEFINVLQNNIWSLQKNTKFKPYILLKNSDVMLNGITSYNFSKTAARLSVPLDVLDNITELCLVCDFYNVDDDADDLLFQFQFLRQENGWFFNKITSKEALQILTPFELFVYAWEAMLFDIDYVCNRKFVHIAGTSIIDYTHHYNMRVKYDISSALINLVKIIDAHAIKVNKDAELVQTVLTDHQINLGTHQSDFKTALNTLKVKGSKRKISL